MAVFPWSELGIDPTSDELKIRRAYTALLKMTKPEDDRDAFIKLRAAYEEALSIARNPKKVRMTISYDNSPKKVTNTAPKMNIANNDSLIAGSNSRDDVLAAQATVVNFLKLGDARGAAEAMQNQALQLLPRAAIQPLSSRLMEVATSDNTLKPEELVAIADQFDWNDVTLGETPALARLRARIDAELWLAALHKTACSKKTYLGDHEVGAARMLLGKGESTFAGLILPEPPLSMKLAQLKQHLPWIDAHFDRRRIASIDELLAKPRERVILTIHRLFWAFCFFSVFYLSHWAQDLPRFILLLVTLLALQKIITDRLRKLHLRRVAFIYGIGSLSLICVFIFFR